MEIKINFRHEEIVAEVLNKSDLTSRSFETAENMVSAENMKANTEEYSVTQILRSIQNAISRLLPAFSPYSPVWGYKDTNDKIVSFLEGDNYLRLYEGKNNDNVPIDISDVALYVCNLPSNFDTSMVDSLASLVHSYVVNVTLGDWFTLTYPAIAEPYKTAALDDYQNVKMSLTRRKRPTRNDYSAES